MSSYLFTELLQIQCQSAIFLVHDMNFTSSKFDESPASANKVSMTKTPALPMSEMDRENR